MKALPWILTVLLLITCIAAWFRPCKQVQVNVVSDTIIIVDTIRDVVPKPYKVTVIRTDTFYLPICIGDSSELDSVPIVFPVEQKEYRTDQYLSVISGFHPNLDFIETYNKMQIVIPKKNDGGLVFKLVMVIHMDFMLVLVWAIICLCGNFYKGMS